MGQKAPAVPDSRTKAVSLRLFYGKVRKKETDESREGGGTTSPSPPLWFFISLCCESHEIIKLHQPAASMKKDWRYWAWSARWGSRNLPENAMKQHSKLTYFRPYKPSLRLCGEQVWRIKLTIVVTWVFITQWNFYSCSLHKNAYFKPVTWQRPSTPMIALLQHVLYLTFNWGDFFSKCDFSFCYTLFDCL